jgi:hypothetical protein
MKTMLRSGAVLMALCLMLCLCACGNTDNGSDGTTGTTAPSTTAPTTATKPSEEPTKPTEAPDYKVTVVDEGGNPVVGAWVQLCIEDGTCTPASTNDKGEAGFYLDEYNYKVSFMVLPEGYEYTSEQQNWYFEDGKTEMTIVLKAVG